MLGPERRQRYLTSGTRARWCREPLAPSDPSLQLPPVAILGYSFLSACMVKDLVLQGTAPNLTLKRGACGN